MFVLLLIGPFETNFNEICIQMQEFLYKNFFFQNIICNMVAILYQSWQSHCMTQAGTNWSKIPLNIQICIINRYWDAIFADLVSPKRIQPQVQDKCIAKVYGP